MDCQRERTFNLLATTSHRLVKPIDESYWRTGHGPASGESVKSTEQISGAALKTTDAAAAAAAADVMMMMTVTQQPSRDITVSCYRRQYHLCLPIARKLYLLRCPHVYM